MTSTVSRIQKITSELMELNAELERELVTLAAERRSGLPGPQVVFSTRRYGHGQ